MKTKTPRSITSTATKTYSSRKDKKRRPIKKKIKETNKTGTETQNKVSKSTGLVEVNKVSQKGGLATVDKVLESEVQLVLGVPLSKVEVVDSTDNYLLVHFVSPKTGAIVNWVLDKVFFFVWSASFSAKEEGLHSMLKLENKYGRTQQTFRQAVDSMRESEQLHPSGRKTREALKEYFDNNPHLIVETGEIDKIISSNKETKTEPKKTATKKRETKLKVKKKIKRK